MIREDLTWFEIPKSKDIRVKNNCGKVCRIKVEGGFVSIKQVIKELNWLIPGNEQWEIEPAGDGIFKVILPSKADMAELNKIKSIELEDFEVTLSFKEWS
jgi:hypothetical protein